MPEGGSVYFNQGSEDNHVTGAKNKVTYFKGEDKKENIFVKEK